MQQSDNNVNVDSNEDFGQDGPNSQTSLEDLCRTHLVKESLEMHFHICFVLEDETTFSGRQLYLGKTTLIS